MLAQGRVDRRTLETGSNFWISEPSDSKNWINPPL